jgi:hypothetical protein
VIRAASVLDPAQAFVTPRTRLAEGRRPLPGLPRLGGERPPPRVSADVWLLALTAAAALVAVVSVQPARPLLVAMAACLVPGAAVLTMLPTPDRLTYLALAVGFSLALEVAGSLALAWLHWWHPEALGIALVVGSAGVLTSDLMRSRATWRLRLEAFRALPATLGRVRRRAALRHAISLGPLIAAVALWAFSLHAIDTRNLGRYGLPPALPLSWYGALAVLICGAVVTMWGARRAPLLSAFYLLALVAVLYATVPAITAEPHYPWVYKHIGVTRSISAYGGVDASGDIYNRWPGLFALAAAFSSWAHVDPLAFAAWAEPFFAALDALLLAAIAFAIGRSWRVAGFAALMFTLGNWVGQNYFAPQAMAFTLALALVLVLVRTLSPGRLFPRLRSLIERVARREQPRVPLAAELSWSSAASITIVLGLDAVIVATHQLTPYILLLQVGALTLLGVARPRWVVMAMAAITFAYLLPNLSYVTRNFGLFTSLNPTSNIQAQEWGKAHVAWLYANSGGALSVTLIALMAASALRLTRLGLGQKAIPILILACAPFGMLFAQNYGGEASLRVFLFSSPWRDVLIALGVQTVPRGRLRLGVALSVALVLAALFIPAFYGAEDTNIIPKDEVLASEYFYAYAPARSTLILAADDFPTRVGSRYRLLRSESDPPPLTGPGRNTDEFLRRPLGQAQIPAIVAIMRGYPASSFLAFSATGYHYAAVHALTPPGALASLEQAVATSPLFRLWYGSSDTRIYQLKA